MNQKIIPNAEKFKTPSYNKKLKKTYSDREKSYKDYGRKIGILDRLNINPNSNLKVKKELRKEFV